MIDSLPTVAAHQRHTPKMPRLEARRMLAALFALAVSLRLKWLVRSDVGMGKHAQVVEGNTKEGLRESGFEATQKPAVA